MRSALTPFRALLVIFPVAFYGSVFATVVDDEIPEVTDRVARVSFIEGDVQIRRNGGDEWEKVVLNLPVVEGDELVSGAGARFEIQFNSYTLLRASERSRLRLVTLKDGGIAISLPEGSVSLRANEFNKENAFIEIDIPRTTIAIEKAGLYRIDAGQADSTEARVRVTDGGEARIYSDTSGFTLKNGRAATIYLSGANAGEWQTADASLFSDDFDTWSLDRDAVLAKRLKDAFYDKYYDRDIYGAEDLSDYGDWIYTRKYGYVWRPYRTSVSTYSDWSPYRYGQWRWIPPYGWTWVNDEPWGWATYHYGRWIWDDGYWAWTPYGYYRYRRSWWAPALVYITVYNNNVCWYPLGYNHRYYSYNRHNYGGRRRNGSPSGGTTPTPGPTQAQINAERTRRIHTPPLSTVPPGGVVTVPVEQFGRERRGVGTPPLAVARTIISRDPEEQRTPPILPPFEQVSKSIGKEIRAESPPIIQTDRPVRTGAADRKSDAPMDEELRKSRIFGNRSPTTVVPADRGENKSVTPEGKEPRDTGAVGRPQRTIIPAPTYVPTTRGAQTEEPRKRSEPRYTPPKSDSPTYVPPPRVETPPTKREEPPVYVPPRRDDTPRYDPPKRSDPPPTKSEPQRDKKPEPSFEKKKDGR